MTVTFKCSKCGEELAQETKVDYWNDVEVTVEPCKCMTGKVEELEARVEELEANEADLQDELKDALEGSGR